MPAIIDKPATLPERATIETLADLLERLGGISPSRVLLYPPPGTATEQDVLDLDDHFDRLCELVDGALVEKAMGLEESLLAIAIATLLRNFMRGKRLGLVAGEGGMMRLGEGLVRIPDVSVVLWDSLPGRRRPKKAVPDIAPDLAVEVLSSSNTAAEIDRKLREYFAAGCRCAWILDPVARSIRIHHSPTEYRTAAGDDPVTAETVLPGFHTSVTEIFEEAEIE